MGVFFAGQPEARVRVDVGETGVGCPGSVLESGEQACEQEVAVRVGRTDCAFGGRFGGMGALGGFLLYGSRHCCGLLVGCEEV